MQEADEGDEPMNADLNVGERFDKVKVNMHHNKINWFCPAVIKGVPQMLVADLSSVVSSYSHLSLFS